MSTDNPQQLPQQNRPPQEPPKPPQPPAVPTPAPEEHGPNNFIRIDEQKSISQFNRKYAFNTWVPSQGYLYGGKFPGGEIIISPMTTSEEKILTQGTKDRSDMIDNLVQRCLVKCPVPYDELLVPDMFYMLLVIRNLTYGAEYKFNLECMNCKLSYKMALDIPTGLKLRCLSEQDDHEPWTVELPVSKDTIQYRLLRVKDEIDIRRWSREAYQRSVQHGDPAYTYRLSKSIVSINGDSRDAVKRLDYLEMMHGRDSLKFRNALESRDFGVRITLSSTCPKCEHETKARMPFDREFFRPSDGEDQF